MSGGVDSSVIVYLLQQAGYEVEGVHLELSPLPGAGPEPDHSDLERTCLILNIPLHYLHLEQEFQSRIIEYFCNEYSLGRTPNPCIRCNKNIKFGLLLDRVREMGGDYLATGHYARVQASETGYRLLKGIDTNKDQSYFLYVLGQQELSRVLFPVGGMCKSEVKQLAAGLGLPAAIRKESQDICFIPDNDSQAFLSARLTPKPGEIVDIEGKVLGQHQGLVYYTIGQRQGMRISAPERLYVIRLEKETNRLVIGPESQLFKNKLIAYNLNWISGKAPQGKTEITAKVRYRSPEVKATLLVKVGKAEVDFAGPQRAIAPGQSVVFYQGEMVIGGGIIAETD
jgi:tRNA-uridine 2-sulfurtransferase